jgi:hypothetical protein
MAQFIVEDFQKTALDALDPATVRAIRKKVLWAGAKVIEKETRNYIFDEHKVSGDLGRSIAQGEIHEDVDRAWVEVYPQGYDSRGVSNELKSKIIINGYYLTVNGKSKRIKDDYIKKMRDRLEPRILATMEYQFTLCMEELNK